MKKRLLPLILLITVLTITTTLYINKEAGKNRKEVAGSTELSKAQKEKLIKENIKKFQPKKTAKTKEEGMELSAVSAIVVNQNTNEIIYQKNPNEKLPPASIAKVLTFSIVSEQFKANEYITISQKASEQISNKINMKAGEKLRTSDLLYGMMMISANDAAYAFADAYPGGFNKFIKAMNEKVELLGLSNSVFKNPAGLDDPQQVSSAFDMATITRYALLEHPEFIDYAGKIKEHSVYMTEDNEPHWWFGHLSAMLKRYSGMIAAKTGYTDEAHSTYVGVAERNGKRLVVVILGSDDANGDVTSLLDYGFAN